MKKLNIFLADIAMMGLFINNATAYDFSALSGGNTLYYNITSSTEPMMVKITSQSTAQPHYTAQQSTSAPCRAEFIWFV